MYELYNRLYTFWQLPSHIRKKTDSAHQQETVYKQQDRLARIVACLCEWLTTNQLLSGCYSKWISLRACLCNCVTQIITTEEAERRGHVYDKEGATYLFDLDYVDDEYTVDAAHYGNISHFVNHSVSVTVVFPHCGTAEVFVPPSQLTIVNVIKKCM